MFGWLRVEVDGTLHSATKPRREMDVLEENNWPENGQCPILENGIIPKQLWWDDTTHLSVAFLAGLVPGWFC